MGTRCRPSMPKVAVRSLVAAGLGALVLGGASCSRSDRATQEVMGHVRRYVQTSGPRRGPDAGLWAQVRRFYERNEYKPAWFRGTRPAGAWDRLAKAVRGAPEHGLDPRAYGLEELQETRERARQGFLRRARFEPEQVGELDVRLTRAFLLYASHLMNGVLEPNGVPARPSRKKTELDPVEVLEDALRSGRVEQALADLAPRDARYRRLADALERESDEERRRTLGLNLDRWRALPRDLGARYLLVNVPTYQLQLVEDGKETLSMRVVVGKPEDPTPVFSDAITHIVFSPTWNVPPGILNEEILPGLKEDDTYLEQLGLQMVKDGKVVDPDDVDLDDPTSFQVRQPPGPENALGRIKFVLPNRYNVYLHDTPNDGAFEREWRTLSHGCVRLEKPVELAERLLGDQPKWTREAIEKASVAGERAVRLTTPLPVHIVYWTAWIDEDGTLQRAEDVYGRDRRDGPVLERVAAREPLRRARR